MRHLGGLDVLHHKTLNLPDSQEGMLVVRTGKLMRD